VLTASRPAWPFTGFRRGSDPAQVVARPRSPKKKLQADGVHSGYEDDMIAFGYQQKELAETLKARIGDLNGQPGEAIRDTDRVSMRRWQRSI
jgi:hypothetical protein